MVKLLGPALGIKASGTLRSLLTYGNWKGRPTLRKKPTPTDAHTQQQIAMRVMFGFLVDQWKTLTNDEKASWADLAQEANITNYNAYLSFNQARWRTFKTPCKIYPPDGLIPTYAGTRPTPFPNGLEAKARHQLTVYQIHDTWGFVLFNHISPGYTATFNHVVAAMATPSAQNYYIVTEPLVPDNYYFRCIWFSTNGHNQVQSPHDITIVV